MKNPIFSVLFSNGTLAIFCAYIALYVNMGKQHSVGFSLVLTAITNDDKYIGILITYSKNAVGHFSYNPTTVVLLTDVVKLLVCAIVHLKEWVHFNLSGTYHLSND